MKRKTARRDRTLILEVGLSMEALLSASDSAEAPVEIGKVVRGVDGDTIRDRMVGQDVSRHQVCDKSTSELRLKALLRDVQRTIQECTGAQPLHFAPGLQFLP